MLAGVVHVRRPAVVVVSPGPPVVCSRESVCEGDEMDCGRGKREEGRGKRKAESDRSAPM